VMVQTSKETQFDDLCFLRVFGGQSVQSFVYLQNFFVIERRFNGGFVEIDTFAATPAFESQFASGVVDENAAHGFAGGTEKVSAIFPGGLLVGAQSQPCFVNESGWLEGLARLFASHFGGS